MSDADPELQRDLVTALRRLGGQGTLGDLMAATTRPAADIEQAIMPALTTTNGHVAVDDKGELIYRVGRREPVIPLDTWRLLGRGALLAFKALFLLGLGIAMVGFAVVYVLLALAAVAIMLRSGEVFQCCECCSGCDGCSCDGSKKDRRPPGRRAGPRASTPANAVATSREQRIEKRQEARRKKWAARRQARIARRAERVVWLRSHAGLGPERGLLGLDLAKEPERSTNRVRLVHDFVFGPPRLRPDPAARERNIVAFIRHHDGRITATDVVLLTGLDLEAAESLLVKLLVRYEGDIEVTDDGILVYCFQRLATTVAEDRELLEWIIRQAGRVTAQEFARHAGVDAATAVARLERLMSRAGGKVDHEGRTEYDFSPAALSQLRSLSSRELKERTFRYCWDELETSPRLVAGTDGQRAGVIALNTFNMGASILCLWLATRGVPVVSEPWAPMLLGYLPLGFSIGVFAIPVVRWVARFIGDNGRLRRNADRVALLGLTEILEAREKLTAGDLQRELYRGGFSMAQLPAFNRELERLSKRLEGTVDEEAGLRDEGFTWVFARVHQELQVVELEPRAADLAALKVGAVVYDSEKG